MNGIVVYYSLEGHTKALVDELVSNYSLDVLELKPIKEQSAKGFTKYVFGGFQAVMKKEPSLEPYEFDGNNYDLIIFASPVWAGTYAPPLRSFFNIERLKNKKVAYFYTHQGGHKNTKKFFDMALKENEILDNLDINTANGSFKEQFKVLDDWIKTWLK